MYSTIELVLAVLQTAIILLGFITNGFVVVNLLTWKFSNAQSASDYYICSVALSNLSLQLWSGFNWFCDFIGNYNAFCQSTYTMNMISTHCSFKVGGMLCLFYCTRIVMSRNWLFRHFQRRHQKSFRKIIYREIISTILLGLPLFAMKKELLTSKSGYLSLNIGSISFVNQTIEDNSFVIYRIFLLSFGYMYPLLLSLVSAACIIISLVKHKKRMQETMKKNDGVFIDAHRRAAITVFSLITLILMYFASSVTTLVYIFPKRDLRLLLCQFISTLYAPALGLVLIRGNSKLRTSATRIRMKVAGLFRLHGLMEENNSVHII